MSTTELIPELDAKPQEAAEPIKPHARKYLPYLVFALCASLYFLPFMRLLFLGTDEGTLVEGAVRVVHGQLLGRDFFEVVGPGTFYWLALFFKLFGVTFLASRICLFISSLGTALSLYFLSRRVCRSYQLLPCILVFATYFGAMWPEISHHIDSNCSALLAVACMVLWQDSRRSWLLFIAGALAGATTLILQPKGILLLFAFLLWLWIQRRGSTSFRALACLAGGCVAVVATMLTYFWSRGALGELIYANFIWPSRYYGPTFSVHYASFIWEYFKQWVVPMHGINWTIGMAVVLISPILFVAVLPALLLTLVMRHGVTSIRGDIALYWLAGSALWLSELHRKDITHLIFGSPLLILLCIFYLQQSSNKWFSLWLQLLYLASACLIGANLMIVLIARPMATRAGEVYTPAYDPVLTAIEEHVPPGEKIFIYPYAPVYYFLSDTTNPTRYSAYSYNFKVGSQFVLDEVVRSLDENRVKYVLWDKTTEVRVGEVLSPSMPLKRFIIAPYFESRYRPVWAHKGVVLMERKDDDHAN